MSETLLHYSRAPLGKLQSIEIANQRDHSKPIGLWVSVQGPDDWESWCRGENFSLDRLAYRHRIELADHAEILRISDSIGIDALTKEYKLGEYRMDWRAIAQRYDGIIIAPYIWSRRLDGGADWYYSWDCASGCIWNAAAIRSVTLIESPQLEESAA